MIPQSTNKIARIPFQCRFLAGIFFCGRLLLLRFHKYFLFLCSKCFQVVKILTGEDQLNGIEMLAF